jgi:hypothetical protein
MRQILLIGFFALLVGCSGNFGGRTSTSSSSSSATRDHQESESKGSGSGAGSASVKGSDSSSRSSDEGAWKPDPQQLDKLGEEISIASYRVRPPKGYVLDRYSNDPKTKAEDGAQFYFEPEKSKTYWPSVRIETKLLEEFQWKEGGDKVVAKAADLEQAWRTIENDFTRSQCEKGTVGGLPSWRCHFGGTETISGKQKLHGTYYLIRDGKIAVFVYFGAVEPDEKDTLKMLEASVQSFHKQ